MTYHLPSIPDNKIQFYRDKLFREVTNLFEWEGLPEEIPTDYLERSLVTHGRVMFFYDPNAYGYMALSCGVRGVNIYQRPTQAFAVAPNTEGSETHYTRTIINRYDENIDETKSCVLINNMYNGESLHHIIEHYAFRLALIQQAFDTNAIWQNIPVFFSTTDNETRLSIEKMFQSIMSGKPWVVVDKALAVKEGVQSDVITVPFLLDKLFDSMNEVYDSFKQTIGIKAVGVDKKERLLVDEVNASEQATETCLEIMLSQRKIACEEIKKVYGIDASVKVRGKETEGGYFRQEETEEGVEEVGDSDY